MPVTRDQIRELKQRRAQLVAEARQILDKAEADGTKNVHGHVVPRALTQDEEAAWSRAHEDERALASRIDREERQLDVEDELNRSAGTIAGRADRAADEPTEERASPDDPSVNRAFNNWLRFGMASLEAEDRQVMQRRASTLSPEQRALAAGTDSAGGFTVSGEALQKIVVALKAFGGIRRARTSKISTSTGADLPFPTSNDTANKGRRIGENKTVPRTDITFGQRVLKAHDYTSDLVLVSLRFLQDTSIDPGSFIMDRLAERLGRIMNEEDTIGTGASMPMGIVNSAAEGKVGASTTAITWDEIYDLIYSLDEAYSDPAEFMFNRNTLKSLKKLKDGQGRYLWQSGVAVREPDTIDRFPFILNLDMPDLATGAKPILFGDMSHFYLRDVLGVQMIRLGERFADDLQVGFMAFMRHDAGLVNAGTDPIKYFKNA